MKKFDEFNDLVILIMIIIFTSFTASFSVGFNDFVQGKHKSVMQVVAEALMHGFMGAIIGFLFTSITDNMVFLMGIAGAGGMIGKTMFVAVVQKFLKLNLEEIEGEDYESRSTKSSKKS